VHDVFAHLYAVRLPHELHGVCEGPPAPERRVSRHMCRRVGFALLSLSRALEVNLTRFVFIPQVLQRPWKLR
jgi:hypothetical protein